jgi:PAS domain S-box-containing protein
MTRARVLLVEDENIVAMEIADLLRTLGYNVCGMVSSGEEAIDWTAKTDPDLTLMDIRLKGKLDGIEAAEEIRRRFRVPVVYLTAYADEATLERAKVTEPFGYLIKPFEERELHTAVEMALYKHRMEGKLKESERWLAATLRSIGDAVVATDAQGLIEFMNPRAQTLTGWQQQDVLGKDSTEVLALVHEETQTSADNPVDRVLRQETVTSPADDVLLVARDETEIPISYSAAPLRDDRDQIVGVVLVFRDISERKRAKSEIAHRLAQTQTLREVMLSAASTLDFDEVLQRSFRALQARMQVESLGFAIPDKEGKEFKIHLPRSDGAAADKKVHLPLDKSICRKVYQTGVPVIIGDVREEPHYFEIDPHMRSELAVPVRAGGQVCGVLNVASRQPNAFGEEEQAFYTAIAGQLGVALENARLYEELQCRADELSEALTQLQELDRLKSEFMQNVSHELRTPLALIRGYTEWLIDHEFEQLPPQQQEMLKLVKRQTHILSDMVEDISLTLLSQTHPLHKEPVAFEKLIRLVVEDYRLMVRDAGLTLRTEIAPELPPVAGLSTYLRRLLDNLLSNAVKFTPAGGAITIGARQQGDNVVVEVSDTGIGIPPNQQRRIFDRFYQVNGGSNRRYGGMGLGLALVKEIVEAHQGTVSVASEIGKGSTFTVTLPLAAERGDDQV